MAIGKKSHKKTKPTVKKKKKADQPPKFQGWRTSDEEEVERRRWRGKTEEFSIESIEPEFNPFGTFHVYSHSGKNYAIEIRSLTKLENSCNCPDYENNGLNTCKHIEGVLHHLWSKGKRAFNEATKQASPRIEVFYQCGNEDEIQIRTKENERISSLHTTINKLLPDITDPVKADWSGLKKLAQKNPDGLRVSRHLDRWLIQREQASQRQMAKNRFVSKVEKGKQSTDILKLKLFPYQVDGMIHLAFGERTLLADEMGLGKTAQAIAACMLLKKLHNIKRVLIVCPASLKTEWEEQIGQFTDLTTHIIHGSRAKRLLNYKNDAFFTLTNYEQIRPDHSDINEILRPDVVILDEAQRIKNWQTQTAQAVKSLHSPYAFVLTGTPLENRIEEIYSIIQYLDPKIMGPLFRFNQRYHLLDEKGKPTDYQNLADLEQRLKPVMLRRRKEEVEGQLPDRTITNYFVKMTDEQRLRYEDYRVPVQRLLQYAKHRPLTKDEFERLQRLLACMRMVCDTPYILDQNNRDCPKLEELQQLLEDLLIEKDRKIIIFSEWVRMLDLIREMAIEMNIDFSWHTGSVPQQQRRAEINRFKQDPSCRLFLSSESGGVGLNLQAANTVINMDLPWNPAKLEQRIARAWRKHQTRPVHVYNLISEDSIENRMLYLLEQKQALSDGVLDGRGDLDTIRLPTGRAAFIERMEAIMKADVARNTEDQQPPEEDQLQSIRDDLLTKYGNTLLSVQFLKDHTGKETLLAVVDKDRLKLQKDMKHFAVKDGFNLKLLDKETFQAILQLESSGFLSINTQEDQEILPPPPPDDEKIKRLRKARTISEKAHHKLKMASLLAGGGFAIESIAPAKEAAIFSLHCMALVKGDSDLEDFESPADLADNLAEQDILPTETRRIIIRTITDEVTDPGSNTDTTAMELITATQSILDDCGLEKMEQMVKL
jgi:ERCC4-related helicase